MMPIAIFQLTGPPEDNLIPVQKIQTMEASLAAGEASGFGDVSAAAKVIKTLSQGDLLNVADGTLSKKDMFIRVCDTDILRRDNDKK